MVVVVVAEVIHILVGVVKTGDSTPGTEKVEGEVR